MQTPIIKTSEPEHSAYPRSEALTARIEPFDSYWQAPEDVEAGANVLLRSALALTR